MLSSTMAVRSEIWNFFTLSEDKKIAKCNLCAAALKYHGGTSTMHSHLKAVHKRSTQTIVKTPGQMKLQACIHLH